LFNILNYKRCSFKISKVNYSTLEFTTQYNSHELSNINYYWTTPFGARQKLNCNFTPNFVVWNFVCLGIQNMCKILHTYNIEITKKKKVMISVLSMEHVMKGYWFLISVKGCYDLHKVSKRGSFRLFWSFT
jgi:hypothetical protein